MNFWYKLFVSDTYTKPDHNFFVNMSVKSAPFQVLRNMCMVPTGLFKNYIVKADHQHLYTVLHIGQNTFLLVNQVEHQTRNHWGNGFYEVPFPLLHTNQHLGKRGPHSLNGLSAKISKICTRPLRQWVLWGPFSIITHKLPPWKTGATQFKWITSKKFRNLHKTTEAMGFMTSLFHNYTQITTLENGDHTVWMDYKQQIPKVVRNHWVNWFYEVAFP